MSSSNWCFLACIQISQETVQMVWYSYIFKNIPQFVVIHTVKGFGIVSKAEIDVFWNFLAFLMIQRMLAIWSLVPLPLLNPAWTSGSSWFMYCWSLAWRILSITLLTCGKGKLLSRVWLLCDLMDCSLPGSSVYAILQASTLEWVAISFFRGSSRPRDQTWVFCFGRQVLYRWATRKAHVFIYSTPKTRFIVDVQKSFNLNFLSICNRNRPTKSRT